MRSGDGVRTMEKRTKAGRVQRACAAGLALFLVAAGTCASARAATASEVSPACLATLHVPRPHDVRAAAVAVWTAEAITRAYHMDSAHWQQQMAALEPDFTPAGWQVWTRSFEESGSLYLVKTSKMSISVAHPASPAVTGEGICSGHRFWTVSLPMQASWSLDGRADHADLTVGATVVEHAGRLGISALDTE